MEKIERKKSFKEWLKDQGRENNPINNTKNVSDYEEYRGWSGKRGWTK
tara:strand:- start:451 stop:594 length:144 start_codon:yes stop_codon:yes gene_type:complete